MIESRRVFAYTIFGLLLYLLWPIIVPVLMGGIFAILFYPWQKRLTNWRLSAGVSSALLSLGITAVILVPLAFLVTMSVRFGFQHFAQLKTPGVLPDGDLIGKLLVLGPVHRALEFAQNFFSFETQDVSDALQDAIKVVGLKTADRLGDWLSSIPSALLGLVIMVMSVFFFLQDGQIVARVVKERSFFSETATTRLLLALTETCRSVILASVVTGVLQALVYTIFCLFVGPPSIPMIALVIFLMSFVPLVGSAPVTFGVAIYHWITVGQSGGIALLVGAVIVVVIDNIVRPAILKGTANLHPLLAFLAVIGGLQTMGFPGIFMGPILASLAVTTLAVLPPLTPAPNPILPKG